jgi:putative chitinase
MIITLQQTHGCCPTNKTPQRLTDALNKFFPAAGIDTAEEIAAFLAQCGHESADFTRLEENLNYSADGLHRTWPRRFPDDAICAEYARHPERIANKVYADRMGNGPEGSGDGWAYHGRGAIQLTGRENYTKFSQASGKTLEELKTYLLTLEGAVESAVWFWTSKDLNILAQKGDTEGLTRRINGGTLGLKERLVGFARCLSVLRS